ncbi:DeoR/GlpR family DNA-binding transcription regulator [Lactobacillus porci]|uniref:DeoR/GlpR family DNA-binding transcription regulator n=1 Tax=Lactobacillus porci TaxID=2012477 RepID=UPI0039959C11
MNKRDQRLNAIIKLLQTTPDMHIGKLQRIIGCSVSTLRRDLLYLENEGLIERKFGKVSLVNGVNVEHSENYRSNKNKYEKEQLCRAAAKLVQNNDAIFIDSSTTVNSLVNFLSEISEVKIITNNLVVASIGQARNNLEIFMACGQIRTLSQSALGLDTIDYLSRFHAHMIFFSVSSISEDGLFMADMSQNEVKKVMMHNSDVKVALIDHTKFVAHQDFIKLCPIDDIDYLITDMPINNETIESQIKKAGIKLIITKNSKIRS